MKKYLVLASQVFSKWVTYRFSVLFGILQSFITPAIMIVAISVATPISDIKTSDLYSYYLIISLVYSIIRSDVDTIVFEYADSGEINNFLVKPLSLYKYLFVQEFSKSFITGITILVPLALFQLVIGSFQINIVSIFMSMVAMFMGFVIYFSLSYFVGLWCFWIERFWAIQNIKLVTLQFLGGVVLPYTFFPEQFRFYLSFTPFPYMASWIREVIGGRYELFQYGMAFVWIVIILLILQVFEKIAISKYSATAG